nr:DNA primase (EC 2.7.7.-) [Kibdelosporangium sp. MJ126-NF4]CTQ95573.1 DNA primase (EC 2.7.7.-) [Kibdelosporangium sp. MJ126-NF4]
MSDGAALLDQAHALLTRYCVLPSPEAADAVVLWCAATHALPVLPFAPRLSVRSATKRSGKSRVLDVVTALSHRPLKTVNATVAAIFRSLADTHPPTMIFDEVDTMFGSPKVAERNEDLRGLLNAGFERGNPSLRCVGPQQIPTEFPSFSMAALAGIGTLPDTIEDRSVIIHMRRRKPGEKVTPFRIMRDQPVIVETGRLLGAWLGTDEARDRLRAAEPLSDLEDRAADVWEGLLAVADLAGRDWPERSRAAARRLLAETGVDEQETSLPVRLLHDIRLAWRNTPGDFVSTSVLLQHLKRVEDGPWSEMDITPHRIGRMLREFGITAKHNSAKTQRGYRRTDFADAWERYPAHDTDPADSDPPSFPRDPGRSPAGEPSEASVSVHTPSDQAQRPDALPDALDVPLKASGKASHGFRRSNGIRTLTDASDTYPGGQPASGPDAEYRQPGPGPTGADMPCDSCRATPTRIDKSGARYCPACAPRLFTAA